MIKDLWVVSALQHRILLELGEQAHHRGGGNQLGVEFMKQTRDTLEKIRAELITAGISRAELNSVLTEATKGKDNDKSQTPTNTSRSTIRVEGDMITVTCHTYEDKSQHWFVDSHPHITGYSEAQLEARIAERGLWEKDESS